MHISMEDVLEEDFAVSGVRLLHLPTGIDGFCALYRSRGKNKREAKRDLMGRLLVEALKLTV